MDKKQDLIPISSEAEAKRLARVTDRFLPSLVGANRKQRRTVKSLMRSDRKLQAAINRGGL